MGKKFANRVCENWLNFLNKFFWKKPLNKDQEYVLLVDQARQDWQWATNLIQEARGENLIDQTIYCRSAAERKYIYLLKQAAQEGIKADFGLVVYFALTARNRNSWGVRICPKKFGRLL